MLSVSLEDVNFSNNFTEFEFFFTVFCFFCISLPYVHCGTNFLQKHFTRD